MINDRVFNQSVASHPEFYHGPILLAVCDLSYQTYAVSRPEGNIMNGQ